MKLWILVLLFYAGDPGNESISAVHKFGPYLTADYCLEVRKALTSNLDSEPRWFAACEPTELEAK